MAEIGLIASVIQVAGAGLKLSQTLYQYAEGVATADRRIKDIAKEIELTSFVIDELGTIFKQDETSAVLKQDAVRSANETMKECSNVFAEIDATLKKSKKGKMGRLMLPFRDNKIELLRSHIDKLKSTLQLLMQVIMLAHQMSTQKVDREAAAKHREEILRLSATQERSAKRYEESLRNFSVSDISTAVEDEDQGPVDEEEPVALTKVASMAAAAISSTITSETLVKCVQHIQGLLEDIERLQQALENRKDGDDHSEHHQSLIGSYFRARGHLDSVLFGSSKSVDDAAQLIHRVPKIPDISSGSSEALTDGISMHETRPSSTPRRGPMADDDSAASAALIPEKEKMKREAEALRAERDAMQLEVELMRREHEKHKRESIQKITERGERLDSLQDKTNDLALTAKTSRKSAEAQISKGVLADVLKWWNTSSGSAVPVATLDLYPSERDLDFGRTAQESPSTRSSVVVEEDEHDHDEEATSYKKQPIGRSIPRNGGELLYIDYLVRRGLRAIAESLYFDPVDIQSSQEVPHETSPANQSDSDSERDTNSTAAPIHDARTAKVHSSFSDSDSELPGPPTVHRSKDVHPYEDDSFASRNAFETDSQDELDVSVPDLNAILADVPGMNSDADPEDSEGADAFVESIWYDSTTRTEADRTVEESKHSEPPKPQYAIRRGIERHQSIPGSFAVKKDDASPEISRFVLPDSKAEKQSMKSDYGVELPGLAAFLRTNADALSAPRHSITGDNAEQMARPITSTSTVPLKSPSSGVSKRSEESARTTATGSAPLRLHIDTSAPITLRHNGDTDEHTLQLSPAASPLTPLCSVSAPYSPTDSSPGPGIGSWEDESWDPPSWRFVHEPLVLSEQTSRQDGLRSETTEPRDLSTSHLRAERGTPTMEHAQSGHDARSQCSDAQTGPVFGAFPIRELQHPKHSVKETDRFATTGPPARHASRNNVDDDRLVDNLLTSDETKTIVPRGSPSTSSNHPTIRPEASTEPSKSMKRTTTKSLSISVSVSSTDSPIITDELPRMSQFRVGTRAWLVDADGKEDIITDDLPRMSQFRETLMPTSVESDVPSSQENTMAEEDESEQDDIVNALLRKWTTVLG